MHRLSPLTGTLPVLQESLSSLGVFILSSKCTELAHEEITFIEELCIKWKILHNSLSELNGTCSTPILIHHPIWVKRGVTPTNIKIHLHLFFCISFSYFSLRSVVDKPPIGGKELLPLTGHSLSGFRLNPGPVSVPNSLKHE